MRPVVQSVVACSSACSSILEHWSKVSTYKPKKGSKMMNFKEAINTGDGDAICLGCIFFDRTNGNFGLCLRYPPVPVKDEFSMYPKVQSGSFCGEGMWSA